MFPEETLTALIKTQSKANLQNTFMRLTDREVAISLKLIDEDIQEMVFSHLPYNKTSRIKEEMRLLRTRIKVPPQKYGQVIEHVISVLQGKSRDNVISYIKPEKRN